MIFLQKFNAHITAHPRIFAAFNELKSGNNRYFEQPKHEDISNFMHGAFQCTQEPIQITDWGKLRLRTANIDDYDFIDTIERDDDCKSWVNNWQLSTRIEKFGDNNFFQTIIETKNGSRIGFIDFRGMLDDTQIELKRIVIAERGKGYGKEAMYLSQRFAFEVLGRNRLHLGTKLENVRAQNLYHATGFKLADPNQIASFHMFKDDFIQLCSDFEGR